MDTAYVKALRALAAVFARQLVLPLLIAVSALFLFLWVGLLLLTYFFSNWWLLALLPLVPSTLLATGLGYMVWLVVQKLTPPMTKTQQQAAVRFVERTKSYTELIGISRFMLAFHLLRHAVRNKPSTYLNQLTRHSTELREDFATLQKEFEKRPRKTVSNQTV
jgi:hypothetical protein